MSAHKDCLASFPKTGLLAREDHVCLRYYFLCFWHFREEQVTYPRCHCKVSCSPRVDTALSSEFGAPLGVFCALSGMSSPSPSHPHSGLRRASLQLLLSLTVCSYRKYMFDLKLVLLLSAFRKWGELETQETMTPDTNFCVGPPLMPGTPISGPG